MVAILLFRRLGLDSVLGHLVAGLAIGPFGLGLFDEPQAILHAAELDLLMFLFLFGLQMQPSHLWNFCEEIFGLGTVQIVVCALVLTDIGILLGFTPPIVIVAASGFVPSSTAGIVQFLAERGDVLIAQGGQFAFVLFAAALA